VFLALLILPVTEQLQDDCVVKCLLSMATTRKSNIFSLLSQQYLVTWDAHECSRAQSDNLAKYLYTDVMLQMSAYRCVIHSDSATVCGNKYGASVCMPEDRKVSWVRYEERKSEKIESNAQ